MNRTNDLFGNFICACVFLMLSVLSFKMLEEKHYIKENCFSTLKCLVLCELYCMHAKKKNKNRYNFVDLR